MLKSTHEDITARSQNLTLSRLNLKQNVAIKITAVYTGLSYAFIMITFLFVWCRPQKGYLELEPENGM